MDNNVIVFDNVTKRYKLFKNDKARFKSLFSKKVKYKTKNAVNNVSFSVKEGEGVALFGRNGAGKSTIMKMITGVTYPTEGEVIVNGRVSALLELTAGFDLESTGRDNIYFKGNLMGITDKEIAQIEDAIIEFAELGEYIDQPVRTYSSGMRARLGFAINVNVNPEILVVDEALSVGDKNFREKCLNKVKEIMTGGKVTFLFVTHSTATAKAFCQRGIFLRNGSIVFDGDIDEAIEIYEQSM